MQEETWAESAFLEFKESFAPDRTGDWCELIKDIVAIANSGGGCIVIGVNDDGTPSNYDSSIFLALDMADVLNKIHKYTGGHLSDLRAREVPRDDGRFVALDIAAVRFPIVFSSPGTYEVTQGKQKTAFGKGTLYFRHGPKSEAGSSEDLRAALERELERLKHFWLDGIAQVIHAPEGSEIHVVKPGVSLLPNTDETQKIRLTVDGDGPEFRVVDNDQLYPYRAKELLQRLKQSVGETSIGSYDIQVVRRMYRIDEDPNFSHKGKFATRQYSEAFVSWVVEQYRSDADFFHKTRSASKSAAKSG